MVYGYCLSSTRVRRHLKEPHANKGLVLEAIIDKAVAEPHATKFIEAETAPVASVSSVTEPGQVV